MQNSVILLVCNDLSFLKPDKDHWAHVDVILQCPGRSVFAQLVIQIKHFVCFKGLSDLVLWKSTWTPWVQKRKSRLEWSNGFFAGVLSNCKGFVNFWSTMAAQMCELMKPIKIVCTKNKSCLVWPHLQRLTNSFVVNSLLTMFQCFLCDLWVLATVVRMIWHDHSNCSIWNLVDLVVALHSALQSQLSQPSALQTFLVKPQMATSCISVLHEAKQLPIFSCANQLSGWSHFALDNWPNAHATESVPSFWHTLNCIFTFEKTIVKCVLLTTVSNWTLPQQNKFMRTPNVNKCWKIKPTHCRLSFTVVFLPNLVALSPFGEFPGNGERNGEWVIPGKVSQSVPRGLIPEMISTKWICQQIILSDHPEPTAVKSPNAKAVEMSAIVVAMICHCCETRQSPTEGQSIQKSVPSSVSHSQVAPFKFVVVQVGCKCCSVTNCIGQKQMILKEQSPKTHCLDSLPAGCQIALRCQHSQMLVHCLQFFWARQWILFKNCQLFSMSFFFFFGVWHVFCWCQLPHQVFVRDLWCCNAGVSFEANKCAGCGHQLQQQTLASWRLVVFPLQPGSCSKQTAWLTSSVSVCQVPVNKKLHLLWINLTPHHVSSFESIWHHMRCQLSILS